MWFRKEEKEDIEMAGMNMIEPKAPKKKKEQMAIDETDYRPVDWKKVFFSPKYIRAAWFLFSDSACLY